MYKIIACNIFRKEVELLTRKNSIDDVIFVEQGLHNRLGQIKDKLQELICEIENNKNVEKKYEGIILLYGLCGNGILGLKTSKLKLIIPKAHDCFTLFLGSKSKYKEIDKSHKGVYWYNHAWINQTPMPSKECLHRIKKGYYRDYDEDNAEYLYELEINSLKKYKYGILIRSTIEDDIRYKKFTYKACKEFNWEYKEYLGDMSLIYNIINGRFNNDEVLIVHPGENIKATLNDDIIGCY